MISDGKGERFCHTKSQNFSRSEDDALDQSTRKCVNVEEEGEGEVKMQLT